VRILTGAFRGRTLPFRPSPHLRPTADKVRKAVTDVFGGKLRGARVIDLFSGTGGLGLEALSQGARRVDFVEKNRRLCGALEAFLAELGAGDRAHVFQGDVFGRLEDLARRGERYDVVLADPPYGRGHAERLLNVMKELSLVEPDGWLVLETHQREKLPSACGVLVERRRNVYGDTAVTYYQASARGAFC
jgi:16S rRNA (guanine(966)-N(2))-methyltransferase RsmD